MIWVVAEGLGLDYGEWVKLYQSNHFKDEFPEDNQRFRNVTYTDDVGGDLERSLRLMRERMLTDYSFAAAVFIGGMTGIINEFDLVRKLQPSAVTVPVISTGGAALDVAERVENLSADLAEDRDYVALFHRHLGISIKEQRYRRPSDQPPAIADRLWSR